MKQTIKIILATVLILMLNSCGDEEESKGSEGEVSQNLQTLNDKQMEIGKRYIVYDNQYIVESSKPTVINLTVDIESGDRIVSLQSGSAIIKSD